MIILIWILGIISLAIIIGEIKYRCFDKKEVIKTNQVIGRRWRDSVDIDMDKLSMECTLGEFVPIQKLSMRGSWRLGQGNAMEKRTFTMLKMQEYKKML